MHITVVSFHMKSHTDIEGALLYIRGEGINKQVNCWMHLTLYAIIRKQLRALTDTLFIQLLLSP